MSIKLILYVIKVMHAFLLRYKLSFFRYTSLANLFNS